MSAGLRSPTLRTATLPTAVSLIMSHRPVRSGCPSTVRGVGAVRFGVPSAVRGMPGVRCCTHCAIRGVTKAVKRVAVVRVCIGPDTSLRLLYTQGLRDAFLPGRPIFMSLAKDYPYFGSPPRYF